MVLIKVLLVNLILTLLIETVIAIVLGLRKKEQLYVIWLMNIITNLILVFTISCIRIVFNLDEIYNYIIILIFEIVVWFVETKIIKWQFDCNIKEAMYVAFVLNCSSFVFGEILNLIGVW